MTGFVSVHITVATAAEAETIAQALVRGRLAACVNIVTGVKSFYHWQGKIEESQEVLLIAKTRSSLFEPLCEAVKSLHSYECPCILAETITAGHLPFMDWLAEETKP